jgi:glycosyltransferase involved in cell wall biosynthesis
MRVLVVSHPCVTPVNQDFFDRAAKLGDWDLTIAVPARWTNEYGARRPERSPGFEGRLLTLRVGLAGNIPLHFYVSRLRAVVERVEPDVAYIHHEPYASATAQWALALKGVPFAFYSAQNLHKRFPAPFTWSEQVVFRRAGLALPVSADVEAVLRGRGYARRSEVLPLAVDVEAFTPTGRTGREPFTVGYIGRLSAEKGVDTLLKGLSAADGVRCRVAGDGPAKEQLQRLSRELGVEDRVEWLGYVEHTEAPAFYRSVDLVAVPSKTVSFWKEQFGRVVIEALACEVPVVTSDSGELPRLIERTGGGWVVPEADPAALSMVLRQARDEVAKRRQLGREGRNGVKIFALDAVAQRFAAALESISAGALQRSSP